MNDAPGSTLHIDTPPTIAIDAGSQWTGCVAREGSHALNGFVVGLTPHQTLTAQQRARLDLDDFPMWHDYYDRVYAAIDDLWDHVWAGVTNVRVVVEGCTVPRRPNPQTERRIPLSSWVPVREINAGVSARFTGTAIVPHDTFGQRHQKGNGGTGEWRDYYPPDLAGPRPEHWMPSEQPRAPRNHEQAAYDLAGVAHMLLAEDGG